MITFIAEDDVVTRHLLQTLLSRWGYTVVTAEDGDTAVAMIDTLEHPALVLLDWMMPGVVGPEVCRRLRNRLSPQDAYVIMLTALSQPEDIVEGLESGVDDYLAKPITPVELRARLQVGSRILNIEKDLIDARRSLAYEIAHDELTGLLNRRSIFEVLAYNIARSARESVPLAVALVEVDTSSTRALGMAFESSLLGQAAECLASAAQGAAKSLRQYDAIGRFGDQSFLVIFPGVGRTGAMNLAMRLMAGLTRHGGGLSIAANIGVASTEGVPEADSDAVILAAEQALARARLVGRNLIEYSSVTGELILAANTPRLELKHP